MYIKLMSDGKVFFVLNVNAELTEVEDIRGVLPAEYRHYDITIITKDEVPEITRQITPLLAPDNIKYYKLISDNSSAYSGIFQIANTAILRYQEALHPGYRFEPITKQEFDKCIGKPYYYMIPDYDSEDLGFFDNEADAAKEAVKHLRLKINTLSDAEIIEEFGMLVMTRL